MTSLYWNGSAFAPVNKTAAKKEVKNKELWIELDSLIKIHSISWAWVKGHSGHPENERADLLANIAIEELT